MNQSPKHPSRIYREGFFSTISVGFFLVLVGAMFTVTPNLFDKMLTFFRDFDLAPVPNQPGWILPAPAFPRTHSVVYTALEKFSLALGLFQIPILVLRFIAHSPLSKKAETISNLVFWLGVGFLTHSFLIEATRWFVFWAGIMILIGVSLIARAIILAVYVSLTHKR